MNNEKQSKDKSQSTSKNLRVEKVHGGTNIEEIETPELMNEPGCPHTNMTRDHSEKDFIAFMCDNPKCGMVKLYQ